MDPKILNIGRFCCDPFGKHKRKIIKGIRVLNTDSIYRNPAFNLTTNHKACAYCRSELAKAPSPKSTCEEKALSTSSTLIKVYTMTRETRSKTRSSSKLSIIESETDFKNEETVESSKMLNGGGAKVKSEVHTKKSTTKVEKSKKKGKSSMKNDEQIPEVNAVLEKPVEMETEAINEDLEDVPNINIKNDKSNKRKGVKNEKTKDENEKNPKKKTKGKSVIDEPVPRPSSYTSLGEGPAAVPKTGKMYMGCHVSAAGGVWKAFDDAKDCNAKSFALFLRSQRQWNAKPLNEDTTKNWKKAMQESGIPPHLILPHGSYLMNLGSPDPETLRKSRALLIEELQRCQTLGIPHFNFHPGSTVGKISREECCNTIAESINLALVETSDVICVIENMSKQGNTIGGDFHEIRLIIEHVKDKSRVGVCIDTCHSHAAGYDLATEEGFQQLYDDFQQIIGWQFLRGIHMNDSKGAAGDHLDRHENIGKGKIGKKAFIRIMNCSKFQDLPLILETPFSSNDGYSKEIDMLQKMVKN